MRIGVDAREIQDGVVTGIGRSLANFVHFFGEKEAQHELVLFSEREIPIEFSGNIKCIEISACPTFLWDQWKLPIALKVNSIDLFYSPYYKVPLITGVPIVNQILDLMFLVFPFYRKKLGFLGRSYYALFGKAFARKAISIITDSEHAKQDIIRLWMIKPEKIVVIPLGVGNRYMPVKDTNLLARVRKDLGLPDKYVLYLGNFKPHKNVASLVHAFKKIAGRFPEYKLILAGSLDEHGLKIQNLVAGQKLMDRIVFTNTIREEDCPEALLSMADLFVFPTLYEGFGLPPLEAMACSTAVITSNLTAVPEVIGDAGVLVNPLDVDELSQAIEDLLNRPEKREMLSKKGMERSKIFSEDKTAGEIYRHIITLLEEI